MLYIDRVEDNALTLYDSYGQAIAQEPLPRGNEIYNFARPFIGHHYYIHNLSNPCSSVDKKRRNLIFALYGHAPAQEPLPRGSRFTIL